jgi:predicted aspartyl protease
VRLPFDTNEGRIVVTAPAPTASRERRFVLDSGASHLILFDRPAQRAGLDINEGAEWTFTTMSEPGMRVRTGHIRHLVVGGQTFHDLPLVLVREASSARLEDGLLPTSLFRAIYFDNRERFVLLNPRPVTE